MLQQKIMREKTGGKQKKDKRAAMDKQKHSEKQKAELTITSIM
jgi:hypothetical protein